MSSESTIKTFSDIVIVNGADVKGTEAFPGLTRRVLAYNENLMLAEHTMEK